MSSSITDLAFSEAAGTLSVDLVNATGGNTHLDADTVIDFQPYGVMVDYDGSRYFVPWSNVKSIKQSLT